MTRSNLLKGLQIVAKYKDVEEYSLSAEHDVLYIAPEIPGLTKEDRAALKKLGFLEDNEAWKAFI